MNVAITNQSYKGIKILGTGSYSPPLRIKNDDFKNFIDTSDEWILSRTGIKERQFITGKPNHYMAIQASKNALENAGVQASEIDMILLSSCSPDFSYPSISCIVQHSLSAKNAACIDINSACNGFISSIDIARNFLLTGKYKKILVVASEKLSSQTDFTDRSTCVLFGDGAGAIVIEASENEYFSYLAASGDDIDNPSLYFKYNYDQNIPFKSTDDEDNIKLNGIEYKKGAYMDGKAVYKFAVEAMPEAVIKTLAQTKYTVSDIGIMIPHQANLRIIQTAAKVLKIPLDKVYTNIETRANTSSACIPTCLDEINKAGNLKPGTLICLVGFGGGFTYGSILFRI